MTDIKSETAFSSVLKISDQECLAKGKQRLVYAHPEDRGLLLKVHYSRNGKRISRRHARREKFVYCLFRNRLKTDSSPPFARYFGTAETDLGPADVFEAFYQENSSQLSPTLQMLCKAGRFDEGILQHLNAFIRKLDDWSVPITDMNAGNFVFCNRYGKRQFVMVDGFGDYRWLPMALLSQRVRRARIATGCQRITKGRRMVWDDETRQFRL